MPMKITSNALVGWERATGAPISRRRLAEQIERAEGDQVVYDRGMLIDLGRAWALVRDGVAVAVLLRGRVARLMREATNPPPSLPGGVVMGAPTAGRVATPRPKTNETRGGDQ